MGLATIYGIYQPNWLGSERGLVRKSATIPASSSYVTNQYGRKIVLSGTYLTLLGFTPTNVLLYEDVDITDGVDVAGTVMTAGWYLNDKLPVSLDSSQMDTLSEHGLYNFVESPVVRPDYGTDTSKLVTPVVTEESGILSWTAVSGAASYDIYKDGKMIKNQTAVTYTPTVTGTYQVVAISNDFSVESSEKSNTVYVEV